MKQLISIFLTVFVGLCMHYAILIPIALVFKMQMVELVHTPGYVFYAIASFVLGILAAGFTVEETHELLWKEPF